MFQKIRVAVVKSTRPVYLAGLTSTLFFAAGVQRIDAHAGLLARHAVYTGIFFLCMWVACRLFASSLNRRLELEGVSAETAGDMIYTFVIYLELIKHVVGVSFTLGWIAGTMFCWDYLGHKIFLIPTAASLAISLVAFFVTFGVASFVDNLHWPGKDDE
ncbi:MAG: hypothetical protein DRH08_08555 [Deltaproteobacteria bacterium]|nr:MAG: hypothetical protein DRH08_08555 [Deltaproteobacteria bacterium]